MGANFARYFVEAAGNTILADHWNGELDNILDNFTPVGMDDASVNLAAFQTNVDPGEVSSESLPTDLDGELKRLRFAIRDIKGTAQWYPTPANNLTDIDADIATLTSDVAALSGLGVGLTQNLGLSLSAGTLTITDKTGSALSGSNKGYVTVPSTTAGRNIVLQVTAPASINDDNHGSSDFTNLGFGITETVDWAQDMPLFLYVANRANSNIDGADGSSVFFLSRNPAMTTTPSAANDIGDTGAIPVNDSQNVIIILGDVTVANYTSLPCQLIGAIRVRWSTATDDWTIQTLGNSDGFGEQQLDKTFATLWTMPAGQNGADASKYFSGGGTSPAFSSVRYVYKINKTGYIDIDLNMLTASAGSGSADLLLALPAANYTNVDLLTGSLFVDGSGLGGLTSVALCDVQASAASAKLLVVDGSTPDYVQAGVFNNSVDFLRGTASYKAF